MQILVYIQKEIALSAINDKRQLTIRDFIYLVDNGVLIP